MDNEIYRRIFWNFKIHFLLTIFFIISIFCILYNIKIFLKPISVLNYPFVSEWHYEFKDIEDFSDRYKSLAVDSKSYIYITCRNYVQKFNSDGKLLIQWGEKGNPDSEDDPPGCFDYIEDISIDRSGNIYLLDSYNNRIQVFIASGDFLKMWTIDGTDIQNFYDARRIVVDRYNNVYILYKCNMVKKFDAGGKLINSWDFLKSCGENGDIEDIEVDLNGNIYIAGYVELDMTTDYKYIDGEEYFEAISGISSFIYKFNPSGGLLSQWKPYKEYGWDEYINKISLDSYDNLFILVDGRNSFQAYDCNGIITHWGSEGSGPGQFKDPQDIAVDKDGNVYVLDSGNNRIQKFKFSH